MAKTAHGGFTPSKGNPSGNGTDQQCIKDLAGVSPEADEQLAEKYTEGDAEEVAANVHVAHPNRNVNKGEDTNKPNQQLDL